MRIFLTCAVILNGALALAQSPSFQNQQRTSGVVGITPGQTARLNVVYPTAPAPILQIMCSVTLAIADDQGKILKSDNVSQLIGGKSVSLDLDADTDLPGVARTQIHGQSIAPNGCRLVATLELIDNSTQKTVLVVGSEQTYPLTPLTPIISRQTNGAQPDTSASQPR
ncbi:MAG TPA: hypothetical protein VK686_18440 [Bryobacteraceae bacterium]|nr:hypothetical protein [Bryobacteraceae bacterium]